MTPDKVFQVSEFNLFIKTYLEQVGEVCVSGEISKFELSQGKWLFITLKDADASLTVFAVAQRISGWRVLQEGMLVNVYGQPTLFNKSGRFSLTASSIVPAGEGALKLAFEKLKTRLEAEGLFAPARKRRLSDFPQRIGLITAPGRDAYNDFLKVLKHRMGGLQVFFYPVSVQGRDAVKNINQAFAYFNANPDLNLDCLVLTRGGGSLEDLQAFNDESVVRSIFSSRFPVVSAIGHERDITLADLVADIRASTPSNSAELIVRERRAVIQEISAQIYLQESLLKNRISSYKHRAMQALLTINRHINSHTNSIKNTLSRFQHQFEISALKTSQSQAQVGGLVQNLSALISAWLKTSQTRVDSLERLLKSLDYREVLKRGFSVNYDSLGRLVTSVKQLAPNQAVATQFFDGRIDSVIKTIYPDDQTA